jgi:hypothetical protein
VASTRSAILAAAIVLGVGLSTTACTKTATDPVPAPTTAAPTSAAGTSAAAPSPSPTATRDATAAWTPYRDATDGFSLRYPATWVQRTCPAGGHTGLFLAPSSAALAVCNSGNVGQMSVTVIPGDQRAGFTLAGSTGLVSTPVTVGGVAGTRHSGTAVEPEALGPPAGTRQILYVFFTRGRTFVCSYSQAPTGATATDVAADFDLMVTTTLSFTG